MIKGEVRQPFASLNKVRLAEHALYQLLGALIVDVMVLMPMLIAASLSSLLSPRLALGKIFLLVFLATIVSTVHSQEGTASSQNAPAAEPEALAVALQQLSAIDPTAFASSGMEQEQLDALAVALELAPKGRHRFLIPRSIQNQKSSLERIAISKLFPSMEAAKEFQKTLVQIAEQNEQLAANAELQKNFPEAYRKRWQAAGIRSILSANTVSWAPVQALVGAKPTPRVLTNHTKTLWPAGSYSMSTTTHFEIVSQAGLKPTEELAELCEQSFAVWKQMFPEFWMPSDKSDSNYASERNERFTVALFRDKAAYIKALKSQYRNIAISTGFYDPNRKLAMFYWDGPRTASTVVHELVHQFFYESETFPIKMNSDEDPGFLFVEGIALYMESMSLRRCGGAWIVDVGGWDSPRFQSGRYRRLRENFWIPWLEFHACSGTDLRNKPDIAQWYSQAAGLTHLWMDGSKDMNRSFQDYLASIYRGQSDMSLLGKLADEVDLRKAYDTYLLRSASDSSRPYFATRNEAVLSQCKITSEQLLAWPIPFRNSKWLELSFTSVGDELFVDMTDSNQTAIEPPWNVSRLSLESSQVSDRSMTAIAKMSTLEELDVSGCAITDAGVAALAENKSVRTLWLNDCPITDASLLTLQTMKGLSALHVSGSKISLQAWERFLTVRPGLKSKSSGP